MTIAYECSCADISLDEWNKLMKHKRKISYKKLLKEIKKNEPNIYNELSLNLNNPWDEQCCRTSTHLILVHSAIEYFFRIIQN